MDWTSRISYVHIGQYYYYYYYYYYGNPAIIGDQKSEALLQERLQTTVYQRSQNSEWKMLISHSHRKPLYLTTHVIKL